MSKAVLRAAVTQQWERPALVLTDLQQTQGELRYAKSFWEKKGIVRI